MYTSMSSRLRGTPEIPAVARRLKSLLSSSGRKTSLDSILHKLAVPRQTPLYSTSKLLTMLKSRLSGILSPLSLLPLHTSMSLPRFANMHLRGCPAIGCVEELAFPRLMKAPKTASYRIGTGGVPCSEAFDFNFLC